MMSRISETFTTLRRTDRKGFIPFIVAGDPDMETTQALIPELERAGADIIELGVPFSDPIADGPVIQRAAERALRHGSSLADIFAMLRQVRRTCAVPIVLFSYYNPLLQFGEARLATEARQAQVDGVLVTDLTPEEGSTFCGEMRRNEIDTIFLVAPTTAPKRLPRILGVCTGFVYLVSRTGVTGAREALPEGIAPMLAAVRAQTDLPVALGFGISTHEQVRAVWQHADAAVIGSAIVARIEAQRDEPDRIAQIGAFVRQLRGGG